MKRKINRYITIIIALFLFFMTACAKDAVIYTDTENLSTTSLEESETVLEESEPPTDIAILEDRKNIMIHICGAVVHPGVYELPENSRMIEAIELAGGFTDDASADYINLAQTLTDGSKVIIPTVAQVEKIGEMNSVDSDSFQTVIEDSYTTKSNDSGGKNTALSKVNINTADETELGTLTGIGQSRAKSIIAYREENGNFRTVEDIMKVSGIKQGSYDKIKEQITVD